MKNDGHEAERFKSLLKRVVTVPKEDIQKRDKRTQEIKKKAMMS
ncbi:MAG: hypothetical protein AB7V11_07185 [Pyrinomonadaceae bacterium]